MAERERRRRGAAKRQGAWRLSPPTPNPASAGKLTVTSARRSTGSRHRPHGRKRRGRHHRRRATMTTRRRRRRRRRLPRRRPRRGPLLPFVRPTTPTCGVGSCSIGAFSLASRPHRSLPLGPERLSGSSRVRSAAKGPGPSAPGGQGSEQWHCQRRRSRHDMLPRQHLFMMKSTISSCRRYMRLSGRREAMIIVATVLRNPTGNSRWWLGLHIFQRTPGSKTSQIRPASAALPD